MIYNQHTHWIQAAGLHNKRLEENYVDQLTHQYKTQLGPTEWPLCTRWLVFNLFAAWTDTASYIKVAVNFNASFRVVFIRVRNVRSTLHIRIYCVFRLFTQHSLLCPECRQSEAGQEYMGTLSTTVSGKTCQAWSSNTPHVPSSTASNDANYPDGSRAAAQNYCRNPINDPAGLWCYTMDPNTRWEYCDVLLCCKSAVKFISRVMWIVHVGNLNS